MLDFKRDQYPFAGADDRTKSELLKDILAFANSWRHATAYILIGVEENLGQRCRVVGVTDHIDDASVQQFVNSKTNRPVEFICRKVHFDSVDIGIIEIPVQERPTYLNRDYGKLVKDAVYIRRGSSTEIVRPIEISKMGVASIGAISSEVPKLSLAWADLDNRTPLSSPHTVNSLVFSPTLPGNTFDIQERHRSIGTGPFRQRLPDFDFNMHINREYSSEIISYAFNKALLKPLGFLLTNESGTVAKRVAFEGSIDKSGGVVFGEEVEQPLPYSYAYSLQDSGNDRDRGLYPLIEEHADKWCVHIDFGDIRPREEVFTAEPLLLGAKLPGVRTLKGDLLGDNIPNPIQCELDIAFEVENRKMCISDVDPYLVEDPY